MGDRIMQIKEKIYKEIDRLPIDQLTLLYEQINTMKKAIPLKKKVKSRYSLHDVHERLSTSKALWSESVIEERENRVWAFFLINNLQVLFKIRGIIFSPSYRIPLILPVLSPLSYFLISAFWLRTSHRGRFSPRRRIITLRAGGQPVGHTGRLPARRAYSSERG